ncbi:MAG: ABC transporter permease [Anaerolineae bacterium]|nr:ABC transporter permease [Anaerolineae bacterium]
MKLLLVARKSLLEMLREVQLLGMVILLPLLFLAITLFSYSGSLVETYAVQVINADADRAFVDAVAAQRHATGQPVFALSEAGEEAAEEALKSQKAVMALRLAPGASGVPAVTLRGDALSMRFYRAGTLLNGLLLAYGDRAAGRPPVLQVTEEPLGRFPSLTYFDLYTPGIIIFALLMIVPQTAMLVGREVRWRTLRRLRLTPLRAWELLGGISLAQMVVAVAQVIIVFVGALLMGFHNHGSLGLTIGAGLAIAFSAVGLGLIVACFVDDDSQAANLGGAAAMIQVFLSGAFFQLPPITLFTLAGHPIDLFDVFPATHGFSALQQVLTYGASLSQVTFRLGATLLLSGVYFIVGVWIFRRRMA